MMEEINTGARQIIICTDREALGVEAARRYTDLAHTAVAARGLYTVALSGGSTPRAIYELLASHAWRERTPWRATHLFWGDERHVPPDDKESNYRMADEAMIAHVPIPPGNVHRIKAELPDANEAADEYEKELRRGFRLNDMSARPRFDLIFLGIGDDGHTASLFPDTAALNEKTRLVVANRVEKLSTERITLTFPVLDAAANVIFLVSGEEKAKTLRAILTGDDAHLPAQNVRPTNGKLLWLVDRAAASLLPQELR